jgi:hypothetical protein
MATHHFFRWVSEIVRVTRYDVSTLVEIIQGARSADQTDAQLGIDFQRVRIQLCKCRRNFYKRRASSLALANHNRRTVPPNGRRGLWSPSSLLVLLLACSVFAWGTSYKLSLYENNPPGSVAPAKLCKLTSDNAKSQVDLVVDAHRALLAGFPINLFSISRELILVIQGQIIPNGMICNLAPLKAAPVLHLRPPPVRSYRLFR